MAKERRRGRQRQARPRRLLQLGGLRQSPSPDSPLALAAGLCQVPGESLRASGWDALHRLRAAHLGPLCSRGTRALLATSLPKGGSSIQPWRQDDRRGTVKADFKRRRRNNKSAQKTNLKTGVLKCDQQNCREKRVGPSFGPGAVSLLKTPMAGSSITPHFHGVIRLYFGYSV